MSEEEVLQLFVQIALAIKHTHDRKILHRDLKPGVNRLLFFTILDKSLSFSMFNLQFAIILILSLSPFLPLYTFLPLCLNFSFFLSIFRYLSFDLSFFVSFLPSFFLLHSSHATFKIFQISIRHLIFSL